MIRRIVNFNIDANQLSRQMLSYQGEHLATELRIHLSDKLLSSDCTYKLLFYLPNGEAKYAVLEYTKSYLKFLIPQSLTMLSGSIKVQLIITDNDNTIIKSRTQRYTIVPSDNVTTKEVDDKYIGLLDSKIQECNKALETAIAQAKNAYQIAVENGFEGTEAEWIASLKGADGKDGINGKDGIDGKNGIDGQDGTDGIGITSTEINASGELVLTYSDGSTANVGTVVGAKGEKGDKGDTGATGSAGVDGQDGKNYQVDIIESTETTVELQPNKFYKFGEVTELNLSLAEITDNTQLNEFMFEFISGETATTLTLPDIIKWSETPSIDANKIYQCSIVNNVGLIVGVAYE